MSQLQPDFPSTIKVFTDQIRLDLVRVVQEPDANRELDSLETVAILSHLQQYSFSIEPTEAQEILTIEGWVIWAGQHLLPS